MFSRALSRISPWLAIFAAVLMTACGGGDGNPNNPYEESMVISPGSGTTYAGQPYAINIDHGQPPFSVFSNNQAVIPSVYTDSSYVTLFANSVSESTPVELTVMDKKGKYAYALVTVNPTLLFPTSVWVTPVTFGCDNNIGTGDPGEDDYAIVCTGGKAIVELQLQSGAGEAGFAGRQVRFDVIQGNFSFRTTDPGNPLTKTVTITTDARGYAAAPIEVPVSAGTQVAKVRATELPGGNQVTTEFVIASPALTVLPSEAISITTEAPDCSQRQSVRYTIFGGTPPYTLTPNPVGWLTIAPSVVTESGGSAVVSTTGMCFTGGTVTIIDAEGKSAQVNLSYTSSSSSGAATPPEISPDPLGNSSGNNCSAGRSFSFTVTGGTAPYSVQISPSSPASVNITGASGTVSFGSNSPANTTYTITVTDSSTPRETDSVSLSCQ